MASILGGVFSHKQGFTTITGLAPGLVFHAVTMALGMICVVKAKGKRQVD